MDVTTDSSGDSEPLEDVTVEVVVMEGNEIHQYEVDIPFASSEEMAMGKAKFAVAHTHHRETDLERFRTKIISRKESG